MTLLSGHQSVARRARYVTDVTCVEGLSAMEREEAARVAARYAFRAHERYLKLIDWSDAADPIRHLIMPHRGELTDWGRLDASDVRNSLRALMWRNVGITRKAQPLAEAQEIIRFWQRYVMDKVFDSPEGWQCQNMLTASLLIAHAADLRQESRGVHYRMDYPETDEAHFKRHIELVKSN